ncbi:MAG: B12-binding domain-containing radical SAM protein [Lachnospiraceae bacterium]|nr:B12-binding domain-containing radical SAM protein [Lachnospiraceae bacterium]
MKFLLAAFNAKYIHSNPGIYSLKAYAGERYAPYIELGEYTINHHMDDILADIYKRRPDVIGFSCYIWNIDLVKKLLPEVHKLLPETELWLGGPEVSFECHEILKEFPFVRGIMVGEGEETFLALLQYYLKENNRAPEDIPGLALSGGYTPEREAMDFSKVPFLYAAGSAQTLHDFENRIIYYESSRGCPFRCSYCLSSIDKRVRLRNISLVKQELQFFLDHKVSQVKFIDRTFNCNHEHAKAVWSYILEHDNGVTNFHFEVAADILDEEELDLLRRMRPGLVQLEIGVQTTNPQTLKEIRRFTNMDKLRRTVEQIHAGGNVHMHLDLIAGLPYEDYDSFARSFGDVYAMKPEQLQLGFLKVLKGSYMHEKAEDYGLRYLSHAPYEVLFTDWLSYENVLRLKRVEEMVELYYNSNQFTHTLPLLEQHYDNPFYLYEALADYYETRGYFVQSPARSYRYQVLLAFTKSIDPDREELYKESLTYDIYLRENAKSRPDFAADITPYKNAFHAFFAEEDKVRSLLPHYEAYDTKQISKMTHLEWFRYPVWDVERAGEFAALEEAVKVLFDYQRRSPLTKEATVYILE